jgi:hypothetical protein
MWGDGKEGLSDENELRMCMGYVWDLRANQLPADGSGGGAAEHPGIGLTLFKDVQGCSSNLQPSCVHPASFLQ